jgi:hypothetical protein
MTEPGSLLTPKTAQNSVITIGTAEDEKRRRAVKEAHIFLDRELGGRWRGRQQSREAIAGHAAPMRRARQIVEYERRKRMFGEPVAQVRAPVQPKVRRSKLRRAQMAEEGVDADTVDRPPIAYTWPKGHRDVPEPVADLSDVQELIVRLRNANVRCPLHGNMVLRLAREVAAGGMPRAAFEVRAAEIAALPSAVPNGVFPPVGPVELDGSDCISAMIELVEAGLARSRASKRL